MMKIGLLWFDNDPKRTLETKISEGAKRYYEKFGLSPNACYVNPASMAQEKAQIGELLVIASQRILLHHFWLGVTELQG